MQLPKDELNERTVWRKYLKCEESDNFDPEIKSAAVFCVREVSGYAVWYRRILHDENNNQVADGNYLLRFFSSNAKHIAIEYAVLAVRSALSPEEAIAALDADVTNALKKQCPVELKPQFELVR